MSKTKKRAKKKARSRAKPAGLKYVVVTTKNYGNKLKGIKICYEGAKPGGLRPDGRINLGKNVLEILSKKFGKKFRWIVSEEESSIEIKYNIARVKTSRRLLQKMSSEQIDRNRDIKNDIINRTFSTIYPSHFTAPVTSTYAPGTLANTLSADIVPKLSADDRDALNAFLPEFIAAEAGARNRLVPRVAPRMMVAANVFQP